MRGPRRDPSSPAATGELPRRFHAAVQRLFPARTSSRLARLLSMTQRDAQYLLAGRLVPVEDLVETLEDQVARVAPLDVGDRVQAIVDEARAAGVHDEVASAAIAHAYEAAYARTID